MNIEPIYVSFNQAKILKEKGFDIPCLYGVMGRKMKLTRESPYKLTNWNIPTRKFISIPEQHQVVEWLFIKHKIYIHTTPIGNENDPIDENCKWSVSIYKDKLYNLKWGSKVIPNVDYFKSRKEAYSAAFDYILNDLI